jgi:hypothetical protein
VSVIPLLMCDPWRGFLTVQEQINEFEGVAVLGGGGTARVWPGVKLWFRDLTPNISMTRLQG